MIDESLRIAFRALTANKLRTLLTMLGIIIGVGAVIALLAIGQGASASVEARFSALGSNVITIVPGTFTFGGVRSASGQAQSLTLDDAEALGNPEVAPAIAAVTPERFFFGQIIALGLNTNARIIATGLLSGQLLPGEGGVLQSGPGRAKALVIVLGRKVADNLFGDADPIDQTVRVNAGGQSVNLRVIRGDGTKGW
ncbi:MAG: ABC transporter permease [Dehalococcoidia bacterium]